MNVTSDGISQLEENFNLTCTVFGAEINITAYQWTKNGNIYDIIDTEDIDSPNTLSFCPLNYSDAGLYTCQVEINSTANGILTFNNSWNISIQSKSHAENYLVA